LLFLIICRISPLLRRFPIHSSEGVSIVIPIYNSAQSLAELAKRIHAVMAKMGKPYEILMVDDGSQDDSWHVISKLSGEFIELKGIQLSRNYGQHNALLCGIRAARMPVIVTIDDDLQTPPEEIPVILSKLDDNSDVVYGTPAKERHSFWRKAASRITKLVLQNAMGARTASRVSAFRVFKTSLREAFCNYGGAFVSIDVLLSWGTTRFESVDVKHDRRKYGQSQYTIRRLVFHALNMMTGFSTLPLEIASLTGFIFLCCRTLYRRRGKRTGLPVSCFYNCNFLRCSALLSGYHRRIPCPDALQDNGQTTLRSES
jgi:undecaprenyl-phosphate 4-deoxy-4-formamido-L-arabinose transferase